jgi:aminoglycoside phosphotransferase (APT) family kinase protein
LVTTRESVLVRVGSVVVKAHPEDTDPSALAVRVAVAAHPRASGILLPPLLSRPQHRAGRWLTVWPYGRPVEPEPDAVPWTAAAGLLARLHAFPPGAFLPGALPPAGGPARVARAVAALAELDHDADADAVRAAWLTLPDWVRGPGRVPGQLRVCHGDWHFGQLVSVDADSWRLCDVDDLGLGDPLWDLGRPAAYLAIGVVTGEEFDGFLDAFLAAGGLLPSGSDPWPALDVPARAYAVQAAARALLVARREDVTPDDVISELLSACYRMADGSR